MSRARVARRIATAAAVGGGGIGILGSAAWGLLLTEAKLAARAIGLPPHEAPYADGLYGLEFAASAPLGSVGGPLPPDDGDTLPPDGGDPLTPAPLTPEVGDPLAPDGPAGDGTGPDTPGGPHGSTAPRSPGAPPAAGTEPLTLAVMGDSLAAGLGVTEPVRTPGALLANGLAAIAERPVQLVNVARSGARSHDLARQLPLALAARPDVVLIFIGANDVTHGLRPAEAVRQLSEAVVGARAAGAHVVVGTCPDLGTIEPVKQPLRLLARRLSRHLAAAQTIAVVEGGGRTVSLGALLGPEFEERPRVMFGPDHFHPSAEGYLAAAMAVLPALCAGLGLWPDESFLEPRRGEGVLPVAEAAAEAAQRSGTEVAGTGRSHWALLKRRRRRQLFTARSAPANLS